MSRRLILTILLALAALPGLRAMTQDERRQYLQKLETIIPKVPSFEAWQQKSGELPPDFDALPRQNDLPDPLKFLDGRPVRTPADWKARRAEIASLFAKYQSGTMPPRPKLDHAVVLDETKENGYIVRNVRLEFGPGDKGTMRVRLTIPDGKGPFPVLMSPGFAGWGAALRRGYINAGFAASDAMDDAAALADLYPNYDFALLPRRGWAAGMVVDYLATLPQVDMKKIALFGYSRDGKMAAFGAALDDRIAAVIPASTGVGGVLPWRLSGERNAGESIESTTRSFPTWFIPRLRFFSGREDRLPIDGNLLIAWIAPRAVLIEYGLNDQVSNTWGDEQAYYSALKVYKLLGVPNRLGILRVPGFHGANDQEACMDWLDIQFGRSTRTWDNHLLFPWSIDKWRTDSKESVDLLKYPRQAANAILASVSSMADWTAKADSIRKSISWMLGDEPPMMPPVARGAFGRGPGRPGAPSGRGPAIAGRGAPGGRGVTNSNPGQLAPDLVQWVIQQGGTSYGWLQPQASEVTSRPVTFGYNVRGDLYYPANTPPNTKLPTVIFLHGFSYPLGYMWVYRSDLHPILALTQAGYAVLAYDQSGFGARMAETGPFYDRYPHWSRMGRMVEDARSAIDALEKDPVVDGSKISIFGYSMGGMVGLYTAALDPRVKGVVSISGFTPMRSDPMSKGDGGIARYSEVHSLIPRLGFFIGHEQQLPYDFNELIATIAPRATLIVEPQLDRDGTPADVHTAVDQARKIYELQNAGNNLALYEPWDYTRLPNATQDWIIDWMKKTVK
ncbi:MAG TPA: alpha/beta fold hydrolase [Bryobacteraceae bacterium]|nr:alpha/beta fold hydrolase [Bryobacteraceae bacterium]